MLLLQLGMLGSQRGAALLQEVVTLGQRLPQMLSFLLQTGMLCQEGIPPWFMRPFLDEATQLSRPDTQSLCCG